MSNSIWIANKDVANSKIGDELALLQPTSGQYFTLNKTGATVWQLLSEARSTEEIITGVAEEYGIEASLCRDDVIELITQLGDAGLIQKA